MSEDDNKFNGLEGAESTTDNVGEGTQTETKAEEPPKPNPNKYNYGPVKKGMENHVALTLLARYLTSSQQADVLSDYRDHIKTNNNTVAGRKSWRRLAEAVQLASLFSVESEDRHNEMNSKDSNWLQRVESESGKKVGISPLRYSIDDGQDVLSGTAAIRYLTSKAQSSSTPYFIPLFDSGVLLSVDGFSEMELARIATRLSEARKELGYETGGAAFSGDNVYIISNIMELILPKVIDTNIKNWNEEMLREVIKVTSIDALLIGVLAAIYPYGYPTRVECINVEGTKNPDGTINKCTHSVNPEEDEYGSIKPDNLIDFKTMVYTDERKLHDTAMRLMSGMPRNKVDRKEIDEYQAKLYEHLKTPPATLFESEGLTIKAEFKIPNYSEYKRTASAWVDSIISAVNSVLDIGEGLDADEIAGRRLEAITRFQASALTTRNLHWYSRLIIVEPASDEDGEERIRYIEDAETIEKTLSTFATNDGFSLRAEEAVDKFKAKCQVDYVGRANWVCPSCDALQTEGGEYEDLIPENAVSYFFYLTDWRLALMAGRL